MVSQVVESINNVEQKTTTLKQTMAELGEQAKGIDQVMTVIVEIADQTNLLALNAAIEAARAQGMKVITLTGKDGGKMAGSADVEIRVPHFGYADRIQEIHIKVIHSLIMLIEKEMVKG